jgi:hypothetical protein
MSLASWDVLQLHRIDREFWDWWFGERARTQIVQESRTGWWAQYRSHSQEVA